MMTRKTIWIVCSIVLVAALAVLIWMPNKNAPAPSLSEASAAPSEVVSRIQSYTVKAYNGGVAVFAEGNDTPFRITDVDLRSLPETDQKELEAGIQVNGLEEVNRLMEDYCS